MLQILLLWCAILWPDAAANPINWPEFRGPNANGHSSAVGLPITWSETENIRWKTPIHDRGWSTPVIWGGQIWTTTATMDGRRMFLVCVDKNSGQVLLDKLLFENSDPEPVADINSYASPTAVLEDGRVYVHFGTYGTACLDTRTFKVLWTRRDLHCRHSVGPGSSPVLFQNLLILTFDGTDVQFTIALNKRTGETIWRRDRKTKWSVSDGPMVNERFKSFNTPTIVDWHGKPLLLSPGAQCAFAYDPHNGHEVWALRNTGYSSASQTLIDGDLAFINTGYDHADLLAVRLGGSGDITDSSVVWKYSKNVPFKPSAILIDGLYYMVSDNGVMTCLDATTGSEIWKERVGGDYSASPIYADGRIYWPGMDGIVRVIKPGRRFEKIAENKLATGIMASPAITGKALIIRTRTHLYRIEK